MQTNSNYTVLCGLFKYKAEKIDNAQLWNNFTHWKHRINGGDYSGTFNYFNTSYYDGYLNNIFPEIRHDKSGTDNLDLNFLNHLTKKSFIEKSTKIQIPVTNEKAIECNLDFADIFLFPRGIGIFAIKISPSENGLSIEEVSSIINKTRQLTTTIVLENDKILIKDFINQKILKPLNLCEDWNIYNPQLKTYNIIDVAEDLEEKEMNALLYDIGNVTPIGSGKGIGPFAPSESYFAEQMSNNRLSVFKNWSAITLFDTFSRISCNYPDTFKSWEYDYFHIYIHCLHIKFYLYLTNSRISDVTKVNRETELIRNEFIEFINDYYQTHISYKFLPDLIQDKLLLALEINSEIEMMETKVKRINQHAQEKRERSMNFVLMLITFLSVFSLIYDLSNWTWNMGVEKDFVYPWLSLAIGITLVSSIFLLFKLKNRN